MRNVRLYIGGKLVDLPEGVSLPITYTTEDFKNPTIVKNSFSKTISLPNTVANNKIFNHFYRLDRCQHTGVFNPSHRVEFQIFCDGELFETGYIQLNSVSGIGENKSYNITLFGGLGDFFYGLKYNEDGTTKTLADLQFFVEDSSGNVRPKDEELTFNINKEFVSECFDNKWNSVGNEVQDFITFIPANNGLYEDFDNGHCLIAADGTIFPTSVTDNDVTYTTKNGFGLASLEKDYTEWQMRDLRSYKQRPAIKVSKLIETICREENSGYKVIFDKSFFSKTNPYWDKSFIALPLLGSEAEGSVSNSSKLTQNVSFPDEGYWVGLKDGTSTREQWARYIPDTYFDVTGQFIDLSSLPELAELSIDLDLQIRFHPENTQWDELFPAAYVRWTMGAGIWGTSFTAQLVLLDEDSETVGYSNLYNFTYTPYPNNAGYPAPNPETWNSYYPLIPDTSTTTVYGTYKKMDNGDYYWQTSKGNNTVRLSINNWLKSTDKVKVCLVINCESTLGDHQIPAPGVGYLYNKTSYSVSETSAGFFDRSATYGWYEPLYDPSTSTLTVKWDNEIVSNAPITKEMLLKTEASPADYLLSYSKLFGLYFVKDVDTKTITIYSRNSFFKNEIVNWENRIDYSKDLTITPLLFDKKWYLMSLETPETYFAKKYSTEYDLTYGQQRMNTGYNFNSEVTELYADNVFENVISATDSDKYFRNFYNSSGAIVPAFLNDNITYTLYNEDNSFETDIYGYYSIDPSKTQDWNVTSGADLFAKPCFFTLDGEEKSLEEITSTIVLYNGHKDLVDYRGNNVPFWITDDLTEMASLNDKTACYLWTNSETFNGEKIAIKKTSLPQYCSYTLDKNSNVTESLDFGLPREIYVDRINYDGSQTIYANFWRAFYDDQFDVNTKKVTCYVKLERATQDMMRRFYFFDNSLWVLNKIDSFDVTSYGTTRCEFIKVQDMNNYLRGVKDYSSRFELTGSLNPTGGTSTFTLDSVYNWEVYDHSFSTISPSSGSAGITDITVAYPANNTTTTKIHRIEFTHSGSTLHKIYTFLLRPNPETYIEVSGHITGYPSGSRLYIEREGGTTSLLLSGDEQDYSVYVQKNSPFSLYVKYNDVIWYVMPFEGSSTDIQHNIEVNYSHYINWSTELSVVDGYIEVDWNTLSIPVTITSNVNWLYVDGSSSCTMNPGSGSAGTTEIIIEPYEENTSDNPQTGYIQLEDTENKDVITVIRWRQKVKPEDKFNLSGSLTPQGGSSILTLDSSDDWEVYSHNFSSVSPESGKVGITQITVNYPTNNSNTVKIYQIEFKRSSTSMHRIFTFTVEPYISDEITVSGTVTGFPTGSILYIQRTTGLGSKSLTDDGTYALKVPKNTEYRLYLQYVDETLYDETFEASSVDVVNDINIDYDYYINYETTLPVDEFEYIELDWDQLTIPLTITANVPWIYEENVIDCTVTPSRGYYGTTNVEVKLSEPNTDDVEMAGFIKLKDAYDKGITKTIRWIQYPQN